MIFLGDLASPSAKVTSAINAVFSENSVLFEGKRIICNLEGLIYDGPTIDAEKPVLFNDPSILDVLGNSRNSVVCLANNHILDLPEMFAGTVRSLDDRKILYCGAGMSWDDAGKPLFFNEGNRSFAIFNSCWDFLLYNHSNPVAGIHVAETIEEKLISGIRDLKNSSPDLSIVAYFHWNLDLETLPFPMHRTFSRALIDAGASLVVGTHSHCVQGGERYKDGYIVYGLGNFFLPDNEYAAGKLVFPSISKISLGLEWDVLNDRMLCHWFEYSTYGNEHHICHTGAEIFENSQRLSEFSPFQGMNDIEYLSYFRNNRRKKMLIPVYRDHRNRTLNRLFTSLLRIRAKIARFLAELKIIKWQH